MTAMTGDPYSRLVNILKVALPLIALGILSTLFLLSGRIEPGSTIPFAEGEITERVQGQQVTSPVFAGVSASGDRISIRADQLKTDDASTSAASTLTARMELAGGGSIVMVSDEGTFKLDTDTASLFGNVLIESSTGYRMSSDRIDSLLSKVDVTSPGEVRATGPAGRLTSGALRIAAQDGSNKVQLLFTEGVKLIYDPKSPE